MLRALTLLRRGLEHGFALLLLALAGRFVWVASTVGHTGSSSDDGGESGVAQAAVPDEGVEADSEGELIQVVVTVTHGANRSQVYVDGALIGHTAFVGDMACRKGSDVTIRVVPRKGDAIERVRSCDGSRISVSE